MFLSQLFPWRSERTTTVDPSALTVKDIVDNPSIVEQLKTTDACIDAANALRIERSRARLPQDDFRHVQELIERQYLACQRNER
jgi:hypothetical protein